MGRRVTPAGQARQDAVLAALRDAAPEALRVWDVAERAGIVYRRRDPYTGEEYEIADRPRAYAVCEQLVRAGLLDKVRGVDVVGAWASGQEVAYRWRGDPAEAADLEALWVLPPAGRP